MTVKRRKIPRYGHVAEHNWYVQGWSDFGNHPGVWHVWCDDCKDYHRVVEIDPLTMPDAPRKAFAEKAGRA